MFDIINKIHRVETGRTRLDGINITNKSVAACVGGQKDELATKNTKGHEKGIGALAFDPAKFRQAGFCLPIHTEKIDRIAELGGNGVWWIDMESAVIDSRYRGRGGRNAA